MGTLQKKSINEYAKTRTQRTTHCDRKQFRFINDLIDLDKALLIRHLRNSSVNLLDRASLRFDLLLYMVDRQCMYLDTAVVTQYKSRHLRNLVGVEINSYSTVTDTIDVRSSTLVVLSRGPSAPHADSDQSILSSSQKLALAQSEILMIEALQLKLWQSCSRNREITRTLNRFLERPWPSKKVYSDRKARISVKIFSTWACSAVRLTNGSTQKIF